MVRAMITTVQRKGAAVTGAPDRPEVARRPALVAGLGLLAMAVVAGASLLGALAPLLAATSAQDVTTALGAGETTLRLGLLGLLVVVLLDVVVAWALRDVLAPVAPGAARLAAWLRLGYAAALLAAAGSLVHAVDVGGTDPAAGLGAATTFTSTWEVALVVFGAHLLVVASALLRGRQAPGWVAVLVALAGVGYVVDGVADVLGATLSFGTVTFVGELVLMVWLLATVGRRS